MNIRIMGLPAEVRQAVAAIRTCEYIEVISVSDEHPNRGDTREVRVYMNAQIGPEE